MAEEVVEIDLAEWKKIKVCKLLDKLNDFRRLRQQFDEVVELRKRIGELGLDTKGTKAELIARLEKYLSEQEVDLLEVDEELEEEEERTADEGTEEEEVSEDKGDTKEESTNGVDSSSSRNNEKRIKKQDSVKIIGPSGDGTSIPVVSGTGNEKLQSRQERFGKVDNDSVKIQARAARFGLAVSDYQGLGKRPGAAPTIKDVDLLKKRANRFGTTTESPILNQINNGEKKNKRQERFGLSAVDASIKALADASDSTESKALSFPMVARLSNRLERKGSVASTGRAWGI